LELYQNGKEVLQELKLIESPDVHNRVSPWVTSHTIKTHRNDWKLLIIGSYLSIVMMSPYVCVTNVRNEGYRFNHILDITYLFY